LQILWRKTFAHDQSRAASARRPLEQRPNAVVFLVRVAAEMQALGHVVDRIGGTGIH